MTDNRRFILASASPRRKELLAKAGYDFDVVVSGVDEAKFGSEGLDSEQLVKVLAAAKANYVADKYPDRLVLGCDTVVDMDGEIIGKPEDADDAERIIRELFSRPHFVISGVALVKKDSQVSICKAVTTKIFPVKLTSEQIAEHIESGSWEGKAGAYGVQEVGDKYIERIEGSYSNVVGLPMEITSELLGKYL